MRKKENGFTLIELLVVISIIALLLAILMPALGKVKEQAKLVVCQSSVKQLGVAAQMYTMDNDDSFHTGYVAGYNGGTPPEYMWPDALRPYYVDEKIRACVGTKKPLQEVTQEGRVKTNGTLGDPALMWGVWPQTEYWHREGDYGSYGFNGWLNNPPGGIDAIGATWSTKNHFRRASAARGSTNNIPVFVDSWWVQGYPDDTGVGAMAPEFDSEIGVTGHEMKRFCINRHGGKLSGVFLDGSARKFGLKELWTLRWHKNFDTNARYHTDIAPWPDWMSSL